MPKKTPTPEPVAETEESTEVSVEFGGETFTIPRDLDDWPTRAYLARITAASTNRLSDWLEFVELLLGPVQWDRLTRSAAGRTRDFKEFLDVFSTVVKEECAL